ncbi:MAG TPA: DUF4177 domain-containing protein [Longimicrobium sp.]|jgi:hypothetical protein|uniref:DUF4177 domain-containing protein n=1 Tax=Longimicrobium sp. TaxID=2029185 RepID=UPI002EDADE96
MAGWEYQTLKVEPGGWLGGKVDIDELRDRLNALGREGWELVSALDTAYGQGQGGTREIIAILKRPLS